MRTQLATILAFTCMFITTQARANDGLVVYIECMLDGTTSKGSGVLVSETGHILTAKHVVPDGASCLASIGNNTLQKRRIAPSFETRRINRDFDAILMKFGASSGETFRHASVCSVTDALKGRQIIAKGFDQESFGAPDLNDGVLSNTDIDFNGMVQMTAETINGKSGGPVFLKETDTIVGIVAGAQFNAQGVVSSYKMLAIDAVLSDLSSLLGDQKCDASAVREEKPDRRLPLTPSETLDLGSDGSLPDSLPQTTSAFSNALEYGRITTRDPNDFLEFFQIEEPVDANVFEICLDNDTEGAKRIRIAGQELLVRPFGPDDCRSIDPRSSGFVQFAKQKEDGHFHIVGTTTFDLKDTGGRGLIFLWSEG